jgi:hypothetical protein
MAGAMGVAGTVPLRLAGCGLSRLSRLSRLGGLGRLMAAVLVLGAGGHSRQQGKGHENSAHGASPVWIQGM